MDLSFAAIFHFLTGWCWNFEFHEMYAFSAISVNKNAWGLAAPFVLYYLVT
jgi:hypothetical protein